MRIVDRYVGTQVLGTTAAAVGVLSVVLVVANAFKQLFELFLNQNTPPELILTFLGFILPFSMTFTVPWGFLTGVLLVFGRMSAEHEITAFRAMGLSVFRLCRPVFWIALCCVGLCVWISVEMVPKAQTRMKRAFFDLATTRPLAMFPSDKVIDEFPGYKIYVSSVEGSTLRDALVFELKKDGSPASVAFAKRVSLRVDGFRESSAESSSGGGSGVAPQLRLVMDEVRCLGREPIRAAADGPPFSLDAPEWRMREHPVSISLEQLYRKSHHNRPLSSLTVWEIGERIAQRREAMREAEVSAGGTAAKGRSVRDLAADICELKWERNGRFSLALASLAFGIIAVPLAVTAQRKETAAGFLMSLAVAFTYFFLTLMVKWVSRKPEWHPEWLVLIPNTMFLILGAGLFRRMVRR
jgi:lipopolysaccharide export LptBFGC system permease protein LptF